MLAASIARTTSRSWKIPQWPLAFLLVVAAIGIMYCHAPDAQQQWGWVAPRAAGWSVTMSNNHEHESIGDLFAQLSQQTRALIEQEVKLAKAEISEKVSFIGRRGAAIAAGGALVYAGLLAIVAGLALGLAALGLPLWAGALICGVVVMVVGYAFVRGGLTALRRTDLAPRQTIDSFKETVQWLRAQAR